MTASHGAGELARPHLKRLPTGFSPSQKASANRWLMMATLRFSRCSSAEKERPAISGIPYVAKKSPCVQVTARACLTPGPVGCSTVAARRSPSASSGRSLAIEAARTPGSARSRSSSVR
jgi:hypothetical protein